MPTSRGWLIAAAPMGVFIGDRYGTVQLFDADAWAELIEVVDGGDWPGFVKWNQADTSALVRSPSEYDPREFLLFFDAEMAAFACEVRRGVHAAQPATAPRNDRAEDKIRRWLRSYWTHHEDPYMPGWCASAVCARRFPCRPRWGADEHLRSAGVVLSHPRRTPAAETEPPAAFGLPSPAEV